MKDLGKWQIVSFISRGLALALGIVQGAIIVRLLPQTDWGIKELALSIGGALGIYQHLGLASASTREISSAKNDTDVFKIFITSVVIRYVITLPLALGLFVFSGYIANTVYKFPELALLLKLYAVALFFQGFQSILNSVISGTMRFKNLFLYQVAIAIISIALFVPLVYFFKLPGFFYAFLAFNIIGTLSLFVIAFKPLKHALVFPSSQDFGKFFRELFTISMAIYFVKIIYTNWEKLGNNVLGFLDTATTVAIYGFALVFSKKILSISDAVTDVNLPVLSERYVRDFEDFKKLFSENFNKIYALILLTAVGGTFWAPQIVYLYTGSARYAEYTPALSLMPVMVFAFILYSLINIVKSSILIPAKMSKEMVGSFVVMLGITLGFFFGFRSLLGNIPAMAWGMLAGGLAGYTAMVVLINKGLRYYFFGKDHYLVLVQAFFVGLAGLIGTWWVKAAAFIPLYTLLVAGLFMSKLLTIADINYVVSKIRVIAVRFHLHK